MHIKATCSRISISGLYVAFVLQEFFMSDVGKSYMEIEWTNQHGCGGNEDTDPHKQNCNLVMQFMCQDESINQSELNKLIVFL